MQTILHARISTADQTSAHQRTWAEKAGFKIDEVVADEGVSSITLCLGDRPQGRRLFDMLRSGDTLVVRWVDRLGRNYADVSDTIRAFMRRGVVIRTVIDGLTFDSATTDPMQQAVRDALIGFMAATARARAEANRITQRSGIDHAREREGAYRGQKPSFTKAASDAVRDSPSRGDGISVIAAGTGLSRQTVYRIRDNPAEAEAAIARWTL